MEGQNTGSSLVKTKKLRIGARGSRRVKTGCQTCKIRHKKCDEVKPACSQCTSTQRACDFLATITTQIFPPPRSDCGNRLSSFDGQHLAYFRTVCAPGFTLYFELPSWETLVLQAASTEPCIRHASLAISALSRRHYLPNETRRQIDSRIDDFAITQYNLAIGELNRTLDDSNRSRELAVLASLVFIALEVLQRDENRVEMHLKNASAILKSHPNLMCPSRIGPEEVGYLVVCRNSASLDLGYLADALARIRQQFSLFMSFQS